MFCQTPTPFQAPGINVKQKHWQTTRLNPSPGTSVLGVTTSFPQDPLAQVCPSPRCGKPRCKDGKAQRQAYYYDITDKVRRLYQSKYSALHAGYGTGRDPPRGAVENRELHDVWDGTILGALFHALDDPEKCHYLYLAQSNDGVEVEKNVTYTPITAKLLNLPPDLRGEALLLSLYTAQHTHTRTVLVRYVVPLWYDVPR